MLGICGSGHVDVELEAQVDDLGAVVDRVADAFGDRRRVAVAVGVQHANGHDPRAVGEAGQPEPIVGRLGDHPGHERAVPLAVERVGVVRDEVVGVDEAGLREVGRFREALPVPVRDARVEHGDRHAAAARAVDREHVRPRGGGVDPHPGQEVPLELLPALGATGVAAVIRDPPAGLVGDVVRHRVLHAGLALQLGDRLPDGLAAGDLDDLAWSSSAARAVSRAAVCLVAWARRRRVPDHDLARDVGGGSCRRVLAPAAGAPPPTRTQSSATAKGVAENKTAS